jgi:hypothetical protein
MIDAAEKTLQKAKEIELVGIDKLYAPVSISHLENMVQEMLKFQNDEGKLGRFLGWMQCAVYMRNLGTLDLDYFRNLNIECKNK